MPYEGEFARYEPLRRIVESERVRELLGQFRIQTKSAEQAAMHTLNVLPITPSGWLPDWVLAVDGSHAEVSIRNGYPGAQAAYLTVAAVMLNLRKLRELDARRPINPKDFRTIQQVEPIDRALPGCNVIYDGELSAESSLRKGLYEIFASTRMAEDSESLLATYEALLASKPVGARPQQCPYEDCQSSKGDYHREMGRYICPCSLARPLYSTDALRTHERMQPTGPNGEIFGEVMQVLERVLIVHFLRVLEAKGWLSSLRRLAIVLDGPLAIFGQPAWLSQAIAQEMQRLNTLVKAETSGQDILLIGVEKSGMFVDHFHALDQDMNGESGHFPNGHVALLTDGYIKEHIIFSESTKPYGDDTYFGRKVLYKTHAGALIVATLPFLRIGDRDVTRAEAEQFPRLTDAMGVIEALVSSRYPNAVVPLVAAHAEAAIPLHLGNKVLERLAKELITDSRLS